MELYSFWDQEFDSMVNEVLDYEDDESDRYSNPEEIVQELKKDSEELLQTDKKCALEDISQKSFDNLSELNPSSDLNYGFTNSGKSEIKRDPIIIDARIFLDSYDDKKENFDFLSSFLSDECKLDSIEDSMKKNIEGQKAVDHQKIEKSSPSVTSDLNRKQESDKLKSKKFKRSNCVKKKNCMKPSTVENIKPSKKENLHSLSPPASLCVGKYNIKSDSIGRRRSSRYGQSDVKSNIEPKKQTNSESVNVSGKSRKAKVSANSNIDKTKKVSPIPSASEKKCKIDKAKVKVEPGFSHSEINKVCKSAESKPNVKPCIDRKGEKLESKQYLLKKQEVDCKSFIDTKKPIERKTSISDYAVDRKNILTLKRESVSGASFKIDPSVNLQPRLALTRAPDYMIYGIPIRTEFKVSTPKGETLEAKQILLLNPAHLPKARVVLKKLTDADLRSPAALLSRVKTEIDENVSRQLRSQGLARNKDFVHRYCCKCKNIKIDRSNISKKKFCENCSFQLIYVCVKCYDKHYISYDHLFRHFKVCRGTGNAKPGYLETIFLHRCTDCTFVTTFPKMMTSHVKRKGHKADGEFDTGKIVSGSKVRVKREKSEKKRKDKRRKDKKSKDEKPEAKPKLHRSKYSKLIVNQNKTSFADATERYCGQCHEARSSKTRKNNEICQKCNTPMNLRCLKCRQEHRNYNMMYRHLRKECSPKSFKCVRCDRTDSSWTSMQWHVFEQHIKPTKSTRKGGKKKSGREQIFYCEICSFQTNWSYNVARHSRMVHKK